MRNVRRLEKPASLANYAARWTRELLDAIQEAEGKDAKVPDKYYDRYKRKNVKEVLDRMYQGLCCYCEAVIGVVSFGHIEHRRPKRRYPNSCFDWGNLHLACEKCNKAKGNKYDKSAEILDAVKDVPISEHLTYDIEWRSPLTPRGETTEQHAGLNRERLRNARLKVLCEALRLIKKINTEPNDPAACVTKARLTSLCNQEYGSLISYAMESFLK